MMLLLAPAPLVAGLAAVLLPRPAPSFRAARAAVARTPVAVLAQEGRSPVERAGAPGSPAAPGSPSPVAPGEEEARARQRARATRRAERDPRWEAVWEATWSDGLLGRLTPSQKRALLPWLPSWLPGVRARMLGYGARKEVVLRQRVAQRRERAEGAVREISSLEVEMAEIREMEIEMERREAREMREVTSLPIGAMRAEMQARVRVLRRDTMEAEVRTLCDKRRMRVRPGDMVLLAAPEGVTASGDKAAWVSRQTNEARTILAELPPPPPGGAEVGVELGVVLMTKRPLELSTWLEYHHRGLGIRHFYMQVEDTPQLASLLCAPPWDSLVVPRFVNGTNRDYFGQIERQAAHITAVLPRARADGVTHLLHIDDDELLYCPSGVAALLAQLAAAPASCPDVHLCNLEALLPGDACASPFQEATVFSHYPTRYLSFTNGKSIGRLDEQSLRPQGPHHFRTERDKGGRGSPITYPLGPETACVLHYESGTYAQWQRKYLELAARHGTDPYYGTDPEVYARVPFAFYRASMLAAAAILTARATADGTPEAEAMVSVAETEALSAARQLWSEHKLAPKGLPQPTTEPRVLSEGLTILDPFITVGLAPRPSPRPAESSQK